MEAKGKTQMIPCPVCTSTDAKDLYVVKGFTLSECRKCHLRFVSDPPSTTDDIYTEEYFFGGNSHGGYVDYDQEKRVMEHTLQRYLDLLEAVAPPSELLDVGAATGYFLGLARVRGWKVAGVELSLAAVAHAREKGIMMHAGTLESAPFREGEFGAVSMIDVLEHTSDPRSFLVHTRKFLRKGGVLLINTPDRGSAFARIMGKRWHLLCPPEHLVFFDRAGLRSLLEEEGYDLVSMGTIGKSFTIQYILNTVARWVSLPFMHKLAQRLQGTKLGEFSLPINLGDNMLAIAKKR